MVAKISSGNSLHGLLMYNQEKVDKGCAKVLLTNRIIEPKNGIQDIRSYLRSFEPYLLANQRTEKPVLHISVNPSPVDTLSDKDLGRIARIYMEQMGYGDQPFVVFKHEDIARTHIHIVSVRVNEYGKKLDHRYERRKSMDICRKLERQFGLVAANRTKLSDNAVLSPLLYKESDLKRQMTNVICILSKDYLFRSMTEYKALLSCYNVTVEEVYNGRKNSHDCGLVYSALNEKGCKVGSPIKSSVLGKITGINALEQHMAYSISVMRKNEMKARSKVLIASSIACSSSVSEFRRKIEKQNLSAVFRINAQGRIYGVTFIDHVHKVVFNGSWLGKEFSANAFHEAFGNQVSVSKKKTDEKLLPEQHPDHEKTIISGNLSGFLCFDFPDNIPDENPELKVRKKKRKSEQKAEK